MTGAHLAYAFVHKNRSSRNLSTADGRVKCVLVCGPSNKSVDVMLGELVIMITCNSHDQYVLLASCVLVCMDKTVTFAQF